MKTTVKNYSIDTVAKTLTLNDYPRIIPERLLLVVNVTRQVLLYQFNLTTGIIFNGNGLTFPSLLGTTAADHLYIVYDNIIGDPVHDAQPVTGAGRNMHGEFSVNTRDVDMRGQAENQAAALESLRFAQQMSTGTGYGGYGYGSYGYGT